MHELGHTSADGGATYVATDGHSDRLASQWNDVAMMPRDVAKRGPFMVIDDGSAVATAVVPPRGREVLKPCITQSKVAKAYSINPSTSLASAHVELAVACRRSRRLLSSSARGHERDGEGEGQPATSARAATDDPVADHGTADWRSNQVRGAHKLDESDSLPLEPATRGRGRPRGRKQHATSSESAGPIASGE